MYIDDSELDRRVTHRNDANVVISRLRPTGRNLGRSNLTMDERAHIAKLAHVFGGDNTAKMVGADRETVSHLKHGRISGNTPKNGELMRLNADNQKSIREKAAELVLSTLGAIHPMEIQGEKIKDRVAIAKDLAAISERMQDKVPQTQIGTVVFYTPKVRDIKDYEKAS